MTPVAPEANSTKNNPSKTKNAKNTTPTKKDQEKIAI